MSILARYDGIFLVTYLLVVATLLAIFLIRQSKRTHFQRFFRV